MAIVRERFNEGASGFIRAQIVDQAGDAVEVASLTSATLTLYDVDTGSADVSPAEGIINSRDQQDILPAGSPFEENDVEYEASGYFQWNLQPEDNIIVTPRRQVERHRAMFIFTWNGGSFPYELEIEVVNLRKVA